MIRVYSSGEIEDSKRVLELLEEKQMTAKVKEVLIADQLENGEEIIVTEYEVLVEDWHYEEAVRFIYTTNYVDRVTENAYKIINGIKQEPRNTVVDEEEEDSNSIEKTAAYAKQLINKAKVGFGVF
ncbi:MAG: hypothetical protein E7254_08650 [Lachnospiraceae bacterium]|nr:hypothetical protein [Lachnospiraceae bacterium]